MYSVFLETAFDKNKHHDLLHIHGRTNVEAELAETFSNLSGQKILPEDIIVDLPEPFSLETDLFVQDEHTSFSGSSSVFSASTVANLENALRIVRIFINPEYEKPFKTKKLFQKVSF